MKLGILSFGILLNLIFVGKAQAQFSIGGGCIVDSNLCEQEDYLHLQLADVDQQVQNLVAFVDNKFPLLGEFLYRTAHSKKWFIEDREFNKEVCAPQGLTEETNISVVACQGPGEIRLSKKYWESATNEQKDDLVLHEIMMNFFLDAKLTPFAARRATFIIKSFEKAGPLVVRNNLVSLGVPMMNTKIESDMFVAFVHENKEAFCNRDGAALSAGWDKFLTDHFELIAEFRSDYPSVAQAASYQIIYALNQGRSCDTIETLAELAMTVEIPH